MFAVPTDMGRIDMGGFLLIFSRIDAKDGTGIGGGFIGVFESAPIIRNRDVGADDHFEFGFEIGSF